LLGKHGNFEYNVYGDTVQQTHKISGEECW